MRHWPALHVRFDQTSSSPSPAVEDRLAAALDGLRVTAIHESDGRWTVFFDGADAREAAARILPTVIPRGLSVESVDVPDEDWASRSQQHLTPVRVGRITIAPPWAIGSDPDAVADRRAGEITILILPSMGFGTGHHASTRLCAELLQRVDLDGKTVLDAGTGSGVLALAARALGARSVVAVDDDPDAIEAARENLALNGVSAGISLRVGDFRTLALEPFDLVTANLTGGLLVLGAGALTRAVAPGGTLIVGGLMREEEADVLAALTPTLVLVDRLSEDEWTGMTLRRPSQAA